MWITLLLNSQIWKRMALLPCPFYVSKDTLQYVSSFRTSHKPWALTRSRIYMPISILQKIHMSTSTSIVPRPAAYCTLFAADKSISCLGSHTLCCSVSGTIWWPRTYHCRYTTGATKVYRLLQIIVIHQHFVLLSGSSSILCVFWPSISGIFHHDIRP